VGSLISELKELVALNCTLFNLQAMLSCSESAEVSGNALPIQASPFSGFTFVSAHWQPI